MASHVSDGKYYLNLDPEAAAAEPIRTTPIGLRLSELDRIAHMTAHFQSHPDLTILCRAIIDPASGHFQQVLACGTNDEVVTDRHSVATPGIG